MGDKDSLEDKKLKKMQADILDAHLNLINYALKCSYSYQGWEKTINSMIFKESGNVMVHQLWVIHLYKADLSALVGIKWRELTFHLFKKGYLDDELFGMVPSKVCQDPVI